MPNQNKTIIVAEDALAHRLEFTEFLAKLPPKDRTAAERRVAVLEQQPDAGDAILWRRLACMLMTLAPHAAKLVGKQTLQVYTADGKYRKQVYALEDLQDNAFTLYCPDVLDEAMTAGLLSPADPLDPQLFSIRKSAETLRIERLDSDSRAPAAHYKDLTGWNRKALRIVVPATPSEAQVHAAELVCALAAQHFPPAPTQ